MRYAVLVALVGLAAPALAQETISPADASASSLRLFGVATTYITKSAEKMPDEHFAFRPAPEVRTYAQLLGHIADAQYTICSMALGEKPPVADIEKTKSTKPDLIEALAGSFAYCNKAHETLSGPKGAEIIDAIRGKHPRIGILYFNTMHTFEHYGNVITYLRMKGIVPPSTEAQQRPSAQ
jgi:uncharacterized damage-inducible protein DinB